MSIKYGSEIKISLLKYVEILKKWNKAVNLSRVTNNFWERHIEDSLQISSDLDNNEKIIDIGTGNGFPGIVLAICGFKNIVLCEKNHKKSAFLLTVKSELSLEIKIYNGDIYNFEEKGYACVSRAFGSLLELLKIMDKMQATKGVFHKGESCGKEINEAKVFFEFDCIDKKKHNK
ncbi:ribosomal RNA small subunit methyltransferase G [Alphaproteobacteria bacterium]|nr:ribosomal RNA small subunit methyltransferase G [Alphaproteobacteria bacterium]